MAKQKEPGRFIKYIDGLQKTMILTLSELLWIDRKERTSRDNNNRIHYQT